MIKDETNDYDLEIKEYQHRIKQIDESNDTKKRQLDQSKKEVTDLVNIQNKHLQEIKLQIKDEIKMRKS